MRSSMMKSPSPLEFRSTRITHSRMSKRKIGLMNLITDAAAGLLQAAQVAAHAAVEDLADVDVAELAVEPAQAALGLGAVTVNVAARDLVDRLAAARDAEP